MRVDAQTLWRPSIQQRFDAWLASEDGQTVYANVRERALRLRERGWRHFGIRPLWEAARYDRALQVGPDEQGFRLNDHYHSRMARLLMEREPDLEGFFETRTLSAA